MTPAAPDAATTDPLPSVSVVIPARDAAATLDACLESVFEQDYQGSYDVVIAVGPSGDDTARVSRRWAALDPRVTAVDNPDGSTPKGLNRAIAASRGAVIVRVDAQSQLQPGYVSRAVATLRRTGAANVGGIQRPVGERGLQRIIAVGMNSPFGAGTARFRRDGYEGPADTVYLGVFDRAALAAVGGYDESLDRNQDYELNWRLRDNGHLVWLDPELVTDYRPRATFGRLASQYYQYGVWKRHVVRRNPRSLQPRQVVAPLLVFGLGLSAVELLRGKRRGLALPVTYVGASLLVARDSRAVLPVKSDRFRLVAVFATMHLAWGWGFLFGRRRPAPQLSRSPDATAPT